MTLSQKMRWAYSTMAPSTTRALYWYITWCHVIYWYKAGVDLEEWEWSGQKCIQYCVFLDQDQDFENWVSGALDSE